MMLSREEAAARLGVSLRSFQRHVQPYLPSIRVGSLLRYDEEDLRLWVDRQKRGDTQQEWPSSGGVYFAQMGGVLGPIKIGSSKDIRKRLGELQTGSPTPLRLLRVIRGGQTEERALHAKFSSCRLEGEWFRATRELLAFAAERPPCT